MRPSPLAPGAPAPQIAAVDLRGTDVTLPLAGGWALVSFLRYASCPACNLRVRELRHRDAELQSAGVQWFAVFHSPGSRLERHMPKDAWTHVLPDPDGRFGSSYRTTRSWSGMALSMLVPSFYWAYLKTIAFGYWGGAIDRWFHTMPADFLIDPSGALAMVHYGRHITDHAGVDEILAAARSRSGG